MTTLDARGPRLAATPPARLRHALAPSRPVTCAGALAGALAAAAVLEQVAYPLVHGAALGALTIATVVTFAAADTAHAVHRGGARHAWRMLGVFSGIGLAVELVGVHTGWPFGRYRYTGGLGLRLDGVPLVVALAWVMLGYPAWRVARRLSDRPAVRIAAGGLALASWDLFLDPQMVAAGQWRWLASGWPRLAGIPLSNSVGWLVAACAVMAAAELILPRAAGRAAVTGGDRLPLGLYLWTYASCVLANLVFFHRPLVALVGGTVMGVVVAALVHRLRGAGPPAVHAG